MKYEEFKDNDTLELFKKSGGNILFTTVDGIINWGRKTHYGLLRLLLLAAVLK